jgi:hypothetical protein
LGRRKPKREQRLTSKLFFFPTEVRLRRLQLTVLFLFFATSAAVGLILWDPFPASEQRFDRRTNGIWLGHKWYTGYGVRNGKPVPAGELDQLKQNLDRHGIRDLFIHVGPALADGTIRDEPGELFSSLRQIFSDARLFAWIGARVENVRLDDPVFQSELIVSLEKLRNAGFGGVHFDFEPMIDFEPGYLELLAKVRSAMGPQFMISQATPRANFMGIFPGPLRRSFWTDDFYLATMAASDQTVLMAYDSGLNYINPYVAFVRHQAGLLVDWACSVPGHEVMIGLPAYEDVPLYSNPKVENLRTASLGVRAALEDRTTALHCLSGVAIYSNWVTDQNEWSDFRSYWMHPDVESAQ